MSLRQYFLLLVGLLSAGYVACIQFIEPASFGESKYLKAFATFSNTNRIWLSFGFAVVASLIATGAVFLKPRRAINLFRESLVDGIFEQLLDNNRNEARITFFRDVRFFGTLWRRGKDLVSLTKSDSFLYAWRYCREAHYIKIMRRWGHHSQNSKTYFCVNRNNPDRCQGIAGLVRQQQVKIVRSLPRIETWDLNVVGENDPTVREFMEKGHILDFRLLKSINKRAPFLYGNIISAKGGSKKFVLVIDSWAQTTPFTATAQKSLDRYVKHLSATFDA